MDDENDCCICLQKLENNILQLDCSHLFHEKCINKWIKNNNNCPMCRKNIKNNSNNSKLFETFIILSIIVLLLSIFMIIFFKIYFNSNHSFYIYEYLINIFRKMKKYLDYIFKERKKDKSYNNIKVKDMFNILFNPKRYIINYIKEMINNPIKIKNKGIKEINQLKNIYLISMKIIEKIKYNIFKSIL